MEQTILDYSTEDCDMSSERFEFRQLHSGFWSGSRAGSTVKAQRVSTFLPFTFAVKMTVYIFGSNFWVNVYVTNLVLGS